MTGRITLAVAVDADARRVHDILSSSDGQRGFWPGDSDVFADPARFGFPQAPVDLEVDAATEPGTAQTGALILDRLVTCAATGRAQPFFPVPLSDGTRRGR